jgi:pumilio RNA-binding family
VQYVIEWSKDQYGSRTIQKALENGSEYLKNKIFDNLVIELSMLIKDKFANYVIQKYLEIGT